VTNYNKDSSLLGYGIYYGRKMFYESSPGLAAKTLGTDKSVSLFCASISDEEKKLH
jgi:hypothetical protein